MKGAESSQKDLQGSEMDTKALLEEWKRKIFPDRGSLICPPGKSMLFYLSGPLIFDCLRPLWAGVIRFGKVFAITTCKINLVKFQDPLVVISIECFWHRSLEIDKAREVAIKT